MVKLEYCIGMQGKNMKLHVRQSEVQRSWKNSFDDLYNMDTQKRVVVYICGFNTA